MSIHNWEIKPLYLKGHDRPVTRVTWNLDGDMLFSVGKDSRVCMWYGSNGERVGTYEGGHQGAINDIAVSSDSLKLLTGGADSRSIIWDCLTGDSLFTFNHDVGVKSVDFTKDADVFLNITDAIMGRKSKIIGCSLG